MDDFAVASLRSTLSIHSRGAWICVAIAVLVAAVAGRVVPLVLAQIRKTWARRTVGFAVGVALSAVLFAAPQAFAEVWFRIAHGPGVHPDLYHFVALFCVPPVTAWLVWGLTARRIG